MPFDAALVGQMSEAVAAEAAEKGWTPQQVQDRVRELVSGAGVQPVNPPSGASPPSPPAAAPDPFAQDPVTQVGMTLQQELLMDEHRPGWRDRLAAREAFQAEAERQAELTRQEHERAAYSEQMAKDPAFREAHFAREAASALREKFWGMSEQERLEYVSRAGNHLDEGGLDASQIASLRRSAAALEEVSDLEAARGGVQGFTVSGQLGGEGGKPRLVRLRADSAPMASIPAGISGGVI